VDASGRIFSSVLADISDVQQSFGTDTVEQQLQELLYEHGRAGVRGHLPNNVSHDLWFPAKDIAPAGGETLELWEMYSHFDLSFCDYVFPRSNSLCNLLLSQELNSE